MHFRFDLILDCSGQDDASFSRYLKKGSCSKYVTVMSPLLRNTDTEGMFMGLLKSGISLAKGNAEAFSTSGSTYRWGYFANVPGALKEIVGMAERGKLTPIVEKVFDFAELPEAYEALEEKSSPVRGKLVIKHD